MGADAAGAGRQDARHGEGHAQRLRDRSGLGRRPHGDHGGQARRARAGHRIQPDMVELSKRNAGQGGRRRQSDLRQSRYIRNRFLAGDSDHDVPAARDQSQAAPEDSRPEAGHAHRVEHVHMGEWKADETATAVDRRLQLLLHGATSGSCRPRSRAPGQSPQGELS